MFLLSLSFVVVVAEGNESIENEDGKEEKEEEEETMELTFALELTALIALMAGEVVEMKDEVAEPKKDGKKKGGEEDLLEVGNSGSRPSSPSFSFSFSPPLSPLSLSWPLQRLLLLLQL